MPPASRPTVLETVFVRGAVRIPVWSVEELIRGGTGGPAAGGARNQHPFAGDHALPEGW